MTDLIAGKEPAKIMAGNSQVIRKYLGKNMFYNFYRPSDFVLWSGDVNHGGDSMQTDVTITLNTPLSKISPAGIHIKLGDNFFARYWAGESVGYTDGSALIPISGDGTIKTSDLLTGKPIIFNTVQSYSGAFLSG